MEKVYRKSRANTNYLESKKNIGANKPIISLKKLAIQTVASIIIFTSIYSMQFFDNPFCEAVLNESAYAVSYTVDLQTLYNSSKQVFKYFLGGIEQSRTYIDNVVFNQKDENIEQNEDNLDTQPQPQPQPQQSAMP